MPDLAVPALDGGDFEHLTITGQLESVERTAAGDTVGLIGSSMGGYLSALYASLHTEQVDRVLLLAPAFGFAQAWAPHWVGHDSLEVHHYMYGEPKRLSRGLIDDAVLYPAEPVFRQPGLIFHGTRDDVVPAARSVEFAASHPNVQLRLLDSDHELTDVLDAIWSEAEPFLR